MARSIRSAIFETRTARLKLPIAKKPLFLKIAPGLSLGYRRNQTAGAWVARVADGKGGSWAKGLGSADDHDTADGRDILDFWQAQDKARTIGQGRHATSQKPATVAEALDAYTAALARRGGDVYNAQRVRLHLPAKLLDTAVVLLTLRDLRRWRDAVDLAPATINRMAHAFKAALNGAADNDERIVSRRAWQHGLASIPNANVTRNVILSDDAVRAIVAGAYDLCPAFGLLVEVAAVTGARVSQLARLEVQDLQADRDAPRLMMPSSRKGSGGKSMQRRPVPIPSGLATRLRAASLGRTVIAPLLLKGDGSPWRASEHSRPFKKVAAAGVTMYSLRHSSIVRQILAAVPIRVVAVNHDTSILMIERTYSRHIGDHSDALARRALLDMGEPGGDAKIVPLRA